MRILIIAMSESIHTARWISQIEDQPWDIHLFPSIDNGKTHPSLENVTVHHSTYTRQENTNKNLKLKGTVVPEAEMAHAARKALQKKSPSYREKQLILLIKKIKPDIIHSLEMQHAGYLTLNIKKQYKGKFPKWIVSCWGSDIYLYGQLKRHRPKIKEILTNCDYFLCECKRDIKLAKDFGFRGQGFQILRSTAGLKLDKVDKLRSPGKTSDRKIIMLKGYQGWSGRALVGLRALKRCASLLKGYKLILYSVLPDSDVDIAAELFSESTNIPVEVVPINTSHSQILKLQSQARISLGLSISDGVPNSMLEAMAMGSFPIQSWTSGADEWIEDGENGLLVPPEDPDDVEKALRKALTDNRLVDKAARKNAKIIRERLEYNDLKKKAIELYKTVGLVSTKFALISHVLPPAPSGQAVMLYRILKQFSPTTYCLISRDNYDQENYKTSWSIKLPVRYYSFIKKFFRLPRSNFPVIWRLVDLINALLEIFSRAIQIAKIGKQENCKILIACTGDLCDLPASYLASRLAHVPLITYIFDDYVFQWTGISRYCARLIEPIILNGSKKIIVTNEFMQKEYLRRCGLLATVIHNPISDPEDKRSNPQKVMLGKKTINIIYAGAIYRAHYDAFRNLITALFLLENPKVRLHLFTAQPLSELELEGISGPKVVYHNHVAHTMVHYILLQADILFLPLAFHSPIPEVIKTSAPGKMGEYLAAGRPILVHAPKDCFISWYFAKHKCGLVVNDSNPTILANRLATLMGDAKLQKRFSKQAQKRAAEDFNTHTAQKRFIHILKQTSL